MSRSEASKRPPSQELTGPCTLIEKGWSGPGRIPTRPAGIPHGTRLPSVGRPGSVDGRTGQWILVGTWRAADWAIDFYEANGFVNRGTDLGLLNRYWEIPTYHAEASVVLEYDPDG